MSRRGATEYTTRNQVQVSFVIKDIEVSKVTLSQSPCSFLYYSMI